MKQSIFVFTELRQWTAHGMRKMAGKGERKRSAFTRCAFCSDNALMEFDKPFSDGKTQASTIAFFYKIVAAGLKFIENIRKKGFWDSITNVAN